MKRFELEELIDLVTKLTAAGINVSIPCKVEKYDSERQLVELQPMIRVPFDGAYQRAPKLVNVPVSFQRGGGYTLLFPIKKGDTGLAVFSDRSFDEWLLTGTEQEPEDPRTHDLSDAVFFPGLKSTKEAPNLAIPAANSKPTLAADLGQFVDFTLHANGSDVDILGKLDEILDQLTALTTAIGTIKMTGVTTGPGISGTPDPSSLAGVTAVATAVAGLKTQILAVKGT